MSDTMLASAPPLPTPAGTFGKPGEPGVRIAPFHPQAALCVIARRGRAQALIARAHERHGLALPATPARALAEALAAVWIAPGQWLILSPGEPDALAARLAEDFADLASIVDQSDARAFFDVSGPRARDALAKMLPIDLAAVQFSPGSAAITLAGHIGVLIWQDDARPTYTLGVTRSIAGSFWHWLTQSAAEYGYEVGAARVL